MMRTDWQDGLIRDFSFGGIRGGPWGAETADRNSFFTLTERSRGCDIETTGCFPVDGGFRREVVTAMAEGRWEMKLRTEARENTVAVSQRLRCLRASVFQDLVLRFTFSSDSFDEALIAGRSVAHKNLNIWHQYPVREVVLAGRHGRAVISVPSCATGNKFYQAMYVRDLPGAWIVHARLLPVEPCDLYWIRWGNRFFTAALSDRHSRRLLTFQPLKEFLWHLSERRGGRPALQAQGLSVLPEGGVIGMDAVCTFSRG